MDFDAAFKKYHHHLYLYALKFVENEGDALDIVQNVFLSVWENNKFLTEEKVIQPYLFHAVKNSCLNYLKHRLVIRKFENSLANELKVMEVSYFESGEKSLIEKENLKLLEDAVNSLTDLDKEVIVLSRYDGLKNQEIANLLQIPLRTVETRIYRALSRLREKLSSKALLMLTLFFYRNPLEKQKNLT
jgi:RNA polymerase sigma-70 factor (ECF subfamily)